MKPYVAERLAVQGIRPSVQRIEVYNYLLTERNHPTVETIYASLSPVIPTLSKTTVYNTLKLFLENDLVQTVTIEDDELRYDADTSFHYHFKCTDCGSITDVAGDVPRVESLLPRGFVLTKTEVSLRGFCATCAKKARG